MSFFSAFLTRKSERTDTQLELARLRQENQALHEKYRILTDNLAAAVVIRDAQGSINYCSPYTEVLTGYAVSEIYAVPSDFFLQIVHEDDREKYKRAIKVAESGEPFQFRYRFFHKSGIEMWAETRTVPIMNFDGNLLFSLSITLDVTSLLRHQRQIEEKNRDLRDFTYMVSHDLKAPIYTIKGMLALLKEEDKKFDPETTEVLEHISQASERLERLVSSVLEYSRISSSEIAAEDVALKDVFEDVKKDFAKQFELAAAELIITNNKATVRGDKLKLYQIFSNLVGNAFKYRHPERALKVEIICEPQASGQFVLVHVKDNGLGIPQDKAEDVFRPFFRLQGTQASGSGIGLAIVKRLLEKIGGEIKLSSNLEEGTCFSVKLRAKP